MELIHISLGGPIHTIQVNGRRVTFEMHPYCGPIAINKRTGESLKHQRMDFLTAVTQWVKGGKRTENDLCVWYHEPVEILKHLGGRHWKLVGYAQEKRGG